MAHISTQQVRTALIQVAEQSNRPHFGMLVVRDVKEAIKNNTYHNLKNRVLREIYIQYGDLYKPQVENTIIIEKTRFMEKLFQIKNYYAGQKVLVRTSGISERTISLLFRGKIELTFGVWKKLLPVLDRVLEDLETYEIEKQKQKHGKYITYRKGCRCDDCRVAWRLYVKGSNQRKKSAGQAEKGAFVAAP